MRAEEIPSNHASLEVSSGDKFMQKMISRRSNGTVKSQSM